jgi:hypothetical protein
MATFQNIWRHFDDVVVVIYKPLWHLQPCLPGGSDQSLIQGEEDK